jgi:hypothetical protein
MSVIKNIDADQLLTIDFAKEKKIPFAVDHNPSFDFKEESLAEYFHWENEYNDYFINFSH